VQPKLTGELREETHVLVALGRDLSEFGLVWP
jgi:hypothetical protein